MSEENKPVEVPQEEKKAEEKIEQAAAEPATPPAEPEVKAEPEKKEEPKEAVEKKEETAPVEKEEKAVEEKKPEPAPASKPVLPSDGPMSKEERMELLAKVDIPPLFGKYDLSEVQVNDPSLVRYINLDPVVLPHTEAKYTRREFGKHRMNIVERLMNNMMRTEKYTGKKVKTYKVVRAAFEIIEKRTKKNPVQVLVDALSNAAPMEEITRLQFGGISVQKAVDTSAARRLDIALRNICKGAVKSTYKTKKPIEQCLADEIILAARGDTASWAVSRKEEIERVAASSR